MANNDQTDVTEVALATDAVNMIISPEVIKQISSTIIIYADSTILCSGAHS